MNKAKITDEEFRNIVADMQDSGRVPTFAEIAERTGYATASGARYRMLKIGATRGGYRGLRRRTQ